MKERPILFHGAMVHAILDGSKMQTRRPVSGRILSRPSVDHCTVDGWIGWEDHNGDWHDEPCPMGKVGDRLWVRETHMIDKAYGQHRTDGQRWGAWADLPHTISADGTQVAYYREGFDRADGGPWRPSIHMPRWASRITLEVTGVRLQRLQDITEEDAIAEGFAGRQAFLDGWAGIYGEGNPLVWAVEFRRVEA